MLVLTLKPVLADDLIDVPTQHRNFPETYDRSWIIANSKRFRLFRDAGQEGPDKYETARNLEGRQHTIELHAWFEKLLDDDKVKYDLKSLEMMWK